MVRLDRSESEPEESENRSSEKETEERNGSGEKRRDILEYEKQRLSRIAENRARMEAMGLFKMAASLMGSHQNSSKSKGKRKVVEDDEEYRPNDGDGDDNGFDDEEEELLGNKASRFAKRKGKNKRSKPKKKAPVQKQLNGSDYVTGDDDELMQAIAPSLQHSEEVSGTNLNERKGKARIQEATGRGKRKKSFTSRVQMTEDEVILHFFQFDEVGKGSINMRDLRRVAVAHDFVWTEEELADMIHCFDSDGDGKLSLEDFRKIVSQCNMIRASEHS